MTMAKRSVVFGVKREDLLYNFSKLSERFVTFAAFKGEEPSPEEGIRVVEPQGYSFKFDLLPVVVLHPIAEEIEDEIGIPADELNFHVSIEDVGLKIRRVVLERSLGDNAEPTKIELPLADYEDLSFGQGFEIRCFVSRKKSDVSRVHAAWHKSHILLERTFVAKASVDEALFDINWYDFDHSPEDREGVLYYVRWKSGEVSSVPDIETFEVAFNNRYRDQFKRLENNRQFGHFSIRLIAQDIVSELITTCLKNAALDQEPAEGSLHEKVKALLEDKEIEFDEWARQARSNDPSALPRLQDDVGRFTQRLYRVGSEIGAMKFGGFRGQ
ncbi:hypothetical protein KUV47_00405 [Vannielia litorea]|uniref:hypothetical protein n=1 Tax=Vannielia litorea TaxID=1217970 RepID=UPI001C9469C7|nr:hypothetical protein [Vannielia litorea]MBY6151658.1 hypothetical protein [Vannielia litorea]